MVPRAFQNQFKSASVGYGDAADIQEVNCRGQLIQRRVAIESEARSQYFECHTIADVREVGAVKVES
jgi:hypothetical protein